MYPKSALIGTRLHPAAAACYRTGCPNFLTISSDRPGLSKPEWRISSLAAQTLRTSLLATDRREPGRQAAAKPGSLHRDSCQMVLMASNQHLKRFQASINAGCGCGGKSHHHSAMWRRSCDGKERSLLTAPASNTTSHRRGLCMQRALGARLAPCI